VTAVKSARTSATVSSTVAKFSLTAFQDTSGTLAESRTDRTQHGPRKSSMTYRVTILCSKNISIQSDSADGRRIPMQMGDDHERRYR
jgi:hypothetical protein